MINDPKHEWLRPDELFVDREHDTQRDKLDSKWVRQLQREWDDRRCGTLLISRRADGTLAVVDGAHRCEVLCRTGRGHEPVRCEVYEGLTLEDEALLFDSHNTRRTSVKKVDQHRVACRAKVAEALGIQTALDQAGVRLTSGGTARLVSPATNAVAALYSCYRGTYGDPNLDGTARLRQVLEVARTLWPDDQKALEGLVLKAVGKVLRHGRRVDVERLAHRIRVSKKTSAAELTKEARAWAVELGLNQETALANRLINLHNYKLKSRKLPLFLRDG